MIQFILKENKVCEVLYGDEKLAYNSKDSIASILNNFAQIYTDKIFVWIDSKRLDQLNTEAVRASFNSNKNIILSYVPNGGYLGREIGYVDLGPFANVNKEVKCPTWHMTSMVGAIHSSLLLKLDKENPIINDFDYYINSLTKKYMGLGVFCYSVPDILDVDSNVEFDSPKASLITLFKFVQEHYKLRWMFLLILNLFLFERRFPLGVFIVSFFLKQKKNKIEAVDFEGLEERVKGKDVEVDVVIPTIGRKKYLLDVLKDLSKQTIIPKNVIIVEQNPTAGSSSELDYLDQQWPFEIKHTFTHQPGACNARNVALKKIVSDWVFFADDDIRFNEVFIEDCYANCIQFNQQAITLECLLENEKPFFKTVRQWMSFGSGCSFVKSSVIKDVFFDLKYEFGFGEDTDYGMQIRNKGVDVVYFPSPSILHLKAPIGGFRTKFEHPWSKESIQPKPSPTVLLNKLKYTSKEQLNGYRLTFFVNYFLSLKNKNPIGYYRLANMKWQKSLYWANHLKNS